MKREGLAFSEYSRYCKNIVLKWTLSSPACKPSPPLGNQQLKTLLVLIKAGLILSVLHFTFIKNKFTLEYFYRKITKVIDLFLYPSLYFHECEHFTLTWYVCQN